MKLSPEIFISTVTASRNNVNCNLNVLFVKKNKQQTKQTYETQFEKGFAIACKYSWRKFIA